MTEYYGLNIDAIKADAEYRRASLVRAGTRRPAVHSTWWRRLTHPR
jgi:hypothetical protein